MIDNELQKKILEQKGRDKQLAKVLEELAELSQIVAKSLNKSLDNFERANLIEEMADVYIVLEYLFIIFDISKLSVDSMKIYKLNNLRERLEDATI